MIQMDQTDIDLLKRQAYWDKGDMDAIFGEIDRARSEEARLRKEAKGQAQLIGVLMGMLETMRNEAALYDCGQLANLAASALGLAGRLK
jgi:hypothetical protein